MSFFALGNVLMDLILETDADYVKKWVLFAQKEKFNNSLKLGSQF